MRWSNDCCVNGYEAVCCGNLGQSDDLLGLADAEEPDVETQLHFAVILGAQQAWRSVVKFLLGGQEPLWLLVAGGSGQVLEFATKEGVDDAFAVFQTGAHAP